MVDLVWFSSKEIGVCGMLKLGEDLNFEKKIDYIKVMRVQVYDNAIIKLVNQNAARAYFLTSVHCCDHVTALNIKRCPIVLNVQRGDMSIYG